MIRFVATFTSLIFLLIALSGCKYVLASDVATTLRGDSLATLNIRVHPAEATVFVYENRGDLIAISEQTGPVASFVLPKGFYNYEVHAQGHKPYIGSFAVPKNQNLEVWLGQR